MAFRIRRYSTFLFCLLLPLAAQANPVCIDGTSFLAFCIIAFWAFVVEAGIVALVLTFRGLSPIRLFGAYFVTNFVVFCFIFQPLLGRGWVSVPVLEGMIVLIDGFAIWLLSRLSPLQGDSYSGVGWAYALVASGFGNVASFLVGYIASKKPWIQE